MFSKPLIMIIARRTRFRLLLIAGGVVVLLIVGLLAFGRGEPQRALPQHNSMEVDAPVIEMDAGSPGQPQSGITGQTDGENYFVNFRLEREKSRQETKNMLATLLRDPRNRDAESKWLALAEKSEQENEIENMLKIKGFKDAVSAVEPDSVSVIVYAGSLSPSQVSMIQDTVLRVIKMRLDRISISSKT